MSNISNDVSSFNDTQSNDQILDQMFARLSGANPTTEDAAPGGKNAFDNITEMPAGWLEISQMAGASGGHQPEAVAAQPFLPKMPETLEGTGLSRYMLEALVLRFFHGRGEGTIRQCARHINLTYNIVQTVVKNLKDMHYIEYTSADLSNDYCCRLTERGQDKAKRLAEQCSYYGSAPISLKDYIHSVNAQSIRKSHPDPVRLAAAFKDLYVNDFMLERLGPAVNSGRGLFLFGPAGNGKTSVAERISLAFGELIWIPRAIFVDNEVIRIYDPLQHETAPVQSDENIDHSQIDHRWIRIKRPTIIVGGELKMSSLDISANSNTGTSEAPLQMKANGGVLVIDDFGRQQCAIDELLNRWIVPLEKRFDFLNTVFGKKICVPFDQLVIFSTNLEPRDLVDDAFLRRIPYKIEVADPTPEEFEIVWSDVLKANRIEANPAVFSHLLDFYKMNKRPIRMCHARDLISQIQNYSTYRRIPVELTTRNLDLAIANYFLIM